MHMKKKHYIIKESPSRETSWLKQCSLINVGIFAEIKYFTWRMISIYILFYSGVIYMSFHTKVFFFVYKNTIAIYVIT